MRHKHDNDKLNSPMLDAKSLLTNESTTPTHRHSALIDTSLISNSCPIGVVRKPRALIAPNPSPGKRKKVEVSQDKDVDQYFCLARKNGIDQVAVSRDSMAKTATFGQHSERRCSVASLKEVSQRSS